jgi:hypothetical protein
MTLIHKNNLPRPGLVTMRGAPVRRRTASRPLLFSATPDQDLVPRVWNVIYPDAMGPVVDAIRDHYEEHVSAIFTFTLPRTAEVVNVRHLSPPAISWSNGISATVSVELEEQLAYQ